MAYYLTVKILNTRGVLGLYFILVSSTRDPKNISDEIKTFVNSFFGKLNEDLTGDNAGRFATLKESVFTKINAPHDNILALFQFIMREVIQKTFYYTRK
jgi:secreted Zn-dependent insulinase-like peptidase